MNESVGSVVPLIIIVLFIAAVSAYMAFNVNYTKAFRMKNKIVDEINKKHDICFSQSSTCYKNIDSYAKELGYNPALSCTDSTSFTYFCYKEVVTADSNCPSGKKHYYSISTTVDINMPIIQNILNLRFLNVNGDTKTFCDD